MTPTPFITKSGVRLPYPGHHRRHRRRRALGDDGGDACIHDGIPGRSGTTSDVGSGGCLRAQFGRGIGNGIGIEKAA
jgi:hypothetical protein